MDTLWKSATRIFVTGLLTVLPLLLTGYLVVWLVTVLERVFSKPLKQLMPDVAPGLGLLIAIGVIFLIGLLMRAYVFRRVFRQFEKLLLETPLVRSIYGALRDLLGLFAKHKEPALQVVAVTMPGGHWRVMGFVTRTEFADVPDQLAREGDVAVYLPMSYQIGGYTIFVPREAITPLEMTREDAMKFILTAGLKAEAGVPAPPPAQPPATAPVQPAGRAPA